jgi:hypothetical protein
VTPEARKLIEQDARSTLRGYQPYQVGETRIKRVGETYLVEHGINGRLPPLSYETSEIQEAIVRFFIWINRRCTSCGSRGCAFDLVGRAPFVVEPLPPEALP